MSHEIRTPMNGIIGMTDLALDTELTAEQREYLEMVKTSADYLLAVVNDILDFSKIEAGKLEMDSCDFSLRDNLDETIAAFSLRAYDKGLELAGEVAPDVPDALVGDLGRLRQIVVNLAGNAIKFTDHGEVVVRVERGSQTGDRVDLHFAVVDTGIGIPADKMEKLFKAFSQLDASTTRKYGGTGLGLAISSQLVQMMGGRLWVESELGSGSTFHFTAQLGLSAEPAQRRLPSESTRLRGLPVLAVDDNAIRAKESTAGGHVPIVAMTARAMKGDRERCLEAGMDGDPHATAAEPTAVSASRNRSAGQSPADRRTSPPPPDSLSDFDKAAAIEQAGGDDELLKELLDDALRRLRPTLLGVSSYG